MHNLKIYEQADNGKRVFTIPAANYAAVKVGLARKGYGIAKSNKAASVVTIQIYKKNE